jgi:superfamily II RNA helicase
MPSISSKFNVDYYYVLKTVSIDAEIYNKSLLQSEQHNMILTELRKISKTELELQNLKSNFNISDEDLKSIMREYELDNYTDFASLNLLLPKSLQKELRNLKNKNNRKEYDEYCNIKKLELDLDRKRQNISKIESYLDYTKSNIIDILIDNKYIKKEENKITLDIYGLCVINCNECNGILLIEMLKNNIFDGLESNDIICLLSIFASYKNENSNRFNKYYGDVYKFINNIKDIWMQRENKLNIFINNDFWETTDGYIDITYEWANNADISVIMNYLQEMEEYEGNFIKNMLKIYNVCLNFKKMCELLNKTDIILKLEDLDKKLLRNIVNVNSLYLN